MTVPETAVPLLLLLRDFDRAQPSTTTIFSLPRGGRCLTFSEKVIKIIKSIKA